MNLIKNFFIINLYINKEKVEILFYFIKGHIRLFQQNNKINK